MIHCRTSYLGEIRNMASRSSSLFLGLLFLVMLSVASASRVLSDVGYSSSDLESDATISALFDRWCAEHGKRHGTGAERLSRLQIFKEKLLQIDAHNREEHSYWMGLNQFSDMTQEEIEARFFNVKVDDLIERSKPATRKIKDSSVAAPPESIDWRWKGAVTRIRDVGNCTFGAWTYATAGAVEGGLKVNGYPLADLSAQQLLDCVEESQKCKYGNPAIALEYVLENGLTKEKLYASRFTGANESCKPLPDWVATITDVERVWGSSDDTDLLEAVAKQPVAVLIDGSSSEFLNYKEGIYTGNCSDTVVNLGVLIVGYGTSNGVPFWTIKNSWGFGWGEAGYMRIQRNAGGHYGKCAINSFPSYPVGTAPGSRPPACGSNQTCPSGMTCCCREPAVGTKCTLYMCCPSKYSDCKNGCCNEKKASAMDELVFTTANHTAYWS